MHPRPRETKLAAKKNGILNEVFRSGSCLRFDLARRLNINATMVDNYVEELLGDGLLVEGDPTAALRGRAPLHINAQHGCFLGLDFEALRARAVLCDFAGALGAAYLGFAKTFPEDEETLVWQLEEKAKLVG